MKVILISFHIQDIGVQGLGQLTYEPDLAYERMRKLMSFFGASEAFYLGTCNRAEFLFVFENQVPEDFSPIGSENPRVYWGPAAVTQHLLDVALSKDSLVFGESQIMGQLKTAYTWAQENGLVGAVLNRLLNLVLKEAKQIRTELGLSSHHTSVSTVAGKELLNHLKSPGASLLLVGAGETHQILARYLGKRGFKNFYWVNRTQARAELAARDLGGTALRWQDLEVAELPHCTAVSLATSAGEVIFNEACLIKVNPQFVADLSVPANADQKTVEACGVRYFGLDEMNERLKFEKALYADLVQELTSKVEASTDRIVSELHFRKLSELFAASVKTTEKLFEESLDQELPHELETLSDEQQKALEKWSRRMVQKVMHSHLEILKQVVRPDSQA